MARWEDEMETIAPAPATHDAAELIAGAQIAAHYFFHAPCRTAGVLQAAAAAKRSRTCLSSSSTAATMSSARRTRRRTSTLLGQTRPCGL